MKLKNIAFSNLRRRKAKAGFILMGLLIGTSAVVAFVSLVDALTSDINHKLEKYGANILVIPKTENLSLTYGGLSLGGFSFETSLLWGPWSWALLSRAIEAFFWRVWILRLRPS